MTKWTSVDDAAFMDAYRAFMQAGGFDLPCANEMLERVHRQAQPRPFADRCPHGLPIATCSLCYPARGGD